MAYAGICAPQDLAPNSDDYFHTLSYDEIDTYTSGASPGNVGVPTATGNTTPTIGALTSFTIPNQTPFFLTASATDPDAGDVLTYCWEEFDLGAAQDPTASPRDNGASVLFRSFDPTTSPVRNFPSLTYILNNANVPPATIGSIISGEFLPTTNRTMTFRVTVRDNRLGGGGSNYASTTVTSTTSSGPFALTSFNTASTIAGGSTQTITWSVANTTAAPVNCANVKISLSTDGGYTFPFVLAASTPNDGSETVTIPNVANVATTQGRFRVEAVGNIFFDLSNANTTITSTNTAPTLSITGSITVQRGTPTATVATVGTVSDVNTPLSVAISDAPADTVISASLSGNNVQVSARADASIATTNTSRTYPVTLTVTDSLGSTTTGTFNLVVQPNPTPTLGNYTDQNIYAGGIVTAVPSAGPADANNNLGATPLTVTPVSLPGGGTLTVNQASGVVTATTLASTTLGTVPVRVTVQDTAGAAMVRGFNLVVAAPTLTAGPNINITKSAENNAETFISMDPTNPLRLFATSTAGASVFKYSADGGVTWNTSNISSIDAGLSGGDQQSAWDSFGNLFVTYFAGSGGSRHTVLALSINGGATFSLLVDTAGFFDQPNVAVGPGSVWFDYTNGGRVARGAAVMGLGAVGTFSAPQTMPGTPGTFGDLGIGPASQVLNVYQTQTGIGPSTIFANLNPTGVGGTFGAQITVTSTNVGDFAPIPSNPDRTIDAEAGLAWDRSGGPRNGRVYLVYTDRPNTSSADTDIYVRFSDNNGTSWSSPVRVNDDTVGNGKSQWFPRIALDQTTGNIAVAWYDCRNSAGNTTVQLWATVSVDGGLTFLPNIQVSTGTTDGTVAALGTFDLGDYNGLDFNAGVFYPSWADNSNSTGDNPAGVGGTTDIYTARVTVGGGPTGPEIAVEQPAVTGLVDGAGSQNFGVLQVGGSAALTFTIRNVGGTNLTGLSISKDGTNNAEFTVGSLGATTLAPSATTTFTVTFSPGALGVRNAAIHIASNDVDENPFDIALTGTAAVQEIAVEQPVGTGLVDGADTRNFGPVIVGGNAALTFTIRNVGGPSLTGLSVSKDGTNNAEFTVGSLGATTLGAGASTTFTVTFAPGAAGVRIAAIHIASNDADENPFDIALTGTGFVPDIAVEQPEGTGLTDGASTVAFGNVLVGAASGKRFAIKNAGTGPLTLGAVSLDGADAAEFSAGTLSATTLQAGGTAYLDVTFGPVSLGAKTAALHFASNDPDESPFDIALTGSGTTPGGPILLARDINRVANGLSPTSAVTIGAQTFFLGTTIDAGTELWRTDGSAAGTFLVKDIFVGATSSGGASLTNVNGTLFFSANNSTNGQELWKSDGTNAGTVLVKDISSGTASSSPANFTVIGTTLYFSATDPTNGIELWKSDGTTVGTVLVANISTTPLASTSSSPSNFRAVGSTLFFTANDGVNGVELWKSDGTAAGTVLVKDIVAGATSSSPTNLNALGSTLIFTVNDTVNGLELWSSDGTTAGTALLKDINAGSVSSSPNTFVSMGGALYFAATTAAEGSELWKTDGTTAGTVLVKNVSAGTASSTPQSLTVVGGTIYFSATEATNGRELWKSDGTTAGTLLVRDISAGTTGSTPTLFTDVGGTVFFSALGDGLANRELWKTDGTAAGTVLVRDINPGLGGSAPTSLVNLGGTLIFSANDGLTGQELWKSDGTTVGTVRILEGQTGSNTASVTNLRAVNGTVFFSANDGINGQELWKSDGSISGTVLVSNISAGAASSSPANLTNIGNTLYFTANDATNGTELRKSDGTAAGTVLVSDIAAGATSSSPTLLTPVGPTLFFSATGTAAGAELWRSDGTAAGTLLVKDIATGTGGSSLASLTNFNGTLFFSANDGVNGQELWKSDGTDAGTTLVLDINPGSVSSSPANLRVIGSMLFFTATTATNGSELWMTDGTAAGTVLVSDIVAGTGSSSPANLAVVGSTLFFSATNGAAVNGTELWKSDGTLAGTVLVKDINPGTASSSPTALVDINGTLYFRANTVAEGTELWKSDGTSAGTVLVSNINSSTASSTPTGITNVYGVAFMNATTAAAGAELWQSNGTGAGTTQVADLMSGTTSSTPANLTVMGNLLFFTARGPELGSSELFVMSAALPPEIVVEQPAGTGLVDGAATINFGSVATGSNGSLQFTIRNIGTADLTGLGISIDGTDAGDFSVTANPAGPVVGGGSTTFTVTFAPVGLGLRNAAIHIASNDADENPFDIAVTGTGTYPIRTIGPDAFGYVGTNNVAFSFTDISGTGTVILDGVDDSSVNVPVGFNFSYYGTTYSTVYVSSNGLLTFGASNTAYSNTDLTTTSVGQPVIAVMWDDWVTNASVSDKAYYATSGSVGSRVFTVQWDVTPYSGGGEAIVQCQLFEATGQMLLNYLDVQTGGSASNGATSTIGIQDTGGNSNGRVIQWSFNTASVIDGISILFGPAGPDIALEQPAGTNLTDGVSSKDFGSVTLGGNSVLTFTVKNTGTTNLIGLSVSKDGANGGDFTIGALGAATLAPLASTTFTVSFAPNAAGARSAAIHIASNDADENPFDVSLTGTGLSRQGAWRFTNFGSTANSGPGADTNDFEFDGMINLLEFCLATDPKQPSQPAQSLVRNGANLEFTYTRANAAVLDGVVFAVKWTDTLTPASWSSVGVSQSILSDNGTVQQVKVTLPAGAGAQRFVHLEVTAN